MAGLLALSALGQPSRAVAAAGADVVDVPQAVLAEVPDPTLRTIDQMLEDNLTFASSLPKAPVDLRFRPTMDSVEYEAAKEAAATAASAASASKPELPDTAGPLAPPSLRAINCDGVDQYNFATQGLYPPDNDGAVGSTQFAQIVNTQIAIYSKAPNPLTPGCPDQLLNVSQNAFFGYATQTFFDARVVFDHVYGRWIFSAVAFPESPSTQFEFIAVSQTDDALGAYNVYAFNARDLSGASDGFWDFPQLGYDENAIIVTGNVFTSLPPPQHFVGARAWFLPKARMYAGLGFQFCFFGGGPFDLGTIAPPRVYDQSNTTVLAIAPNNRNFLSITKFTATNAVCPISLGSANIAVAAYTIPPNAPQPGTTSRLDTGDNRFQNRSTQNGMFLWQTHSVALGSVSTNRFYRINWSNNTIAQTGTFFASGTSYDFAPSIAANGTDDVVVTWSASSSVEMPQMRLSGKQNADAIIPVGGTVVGISAVPLTSNGGAVQRWGDYSGTSFDFFTGQWWIVNELAQDDPLGAFPNMWLSHFASAGIP
jgi:hypothetical protein